MKIIFEDKDLANATPEQMQLLAILIKEMAADYSVTREEVVDLCNELRESGMEKEVMKILKAYGKGLSDIPDNALPEIHVELLNLKNSKRD